MRVEWDLLQEQMDDLDGVTIPTPYLQQFLHTHTHTHIRTHTF